MPKGFCTIVGATDPDGRSIPLRKLVENGWVTPVRAPSGWGIGPDELPLGKNLFLDNARQYTAFSLTFRAPISNYTLQNYGVGTGLTPPTVADTSLENAVTLSNLSTIAPIDGVDYPAPFVTQTRFTLGVNDANGYALTEFGLFSGDGTILMRWVTPALNKSSAWAPTLVHRSVY